MGPTIHLDFLVRTCDSDGTPFADADFSAFEDYLLGTTGGFTRHRDLEASRYGVTMGGRSRMYSLTLSKDRAAMLVSLVSGYLLSDFRQTAMFVERIPTRHAES